MSLQERAKKIYHRIDPYCVESESEKIVKDVSNLLNIPCGVSLILSVVRCAALLCCKNIEEINDGLLTFYDHTLSVWSDDHNLSNEKTISKVQVEETKKVLYTMYALLSV